MGLWDSYKQRFMDNLRHGAGDGLKAAATGRSASEVAAERRAKQRPQMDDAALQEFLLKEWHRNREIALKERARGNKNLIETTTEVAYISGLPVVVKFNNNSEPGRIDVYYGGGGAHPLDAPDDDYHGHVVIRDGEVKSWLEPGPKNSRHQRV